MNNSELNELFNEFLTIIRQEHRSAEARLVDLKNRIYQQQTALNRNRQLFAGKPVKREADGDVLFAV